MYEKKYCSKCKCTKTIDLFHNNKSQKDKKTSWCGECCSVYINNRYHNDRKIIEKFNIKQQNMLPDERNIYLVNLYKQKINYKD